MSLPKIKNKYLEFSDNYRIIWRNNQRRYIGEVRNYAVDGNGFRIMIIILDDKHMRKINMRYLGTSWNLRGPIIYVSKQFIQLSEDMKLAGILHEVDTFILSIFFRRTT